MPIRSTQDERRHVVEPSAALTCDDDSRGLRPRVLARGARRSRCARPRPLTRPPRRLADAPRGVRADVAEQVPAARRERVTGSLTGRRGRCDRARRTARSKAPAAVRPRAPRARPTWPTLGLTMVGHVRLRQLRRRDRGGRRARRCRTTSSSSARGAAARMTSQGRCLHVAGANGARAARRTPRPAPLRRRRDPVRPARSTRRCSSTRTWPST